jgi:hypothetical protein
MLEQGILGPWEYLNDFPSSYGDLINFPVPLLQDKSLEQIQDQCERLAEDGSEILTLRPINVGTIIYGAKKSLLFQSSVSNKGFQTYTEQKKPSFMVEALGKLGLYKYSPMLSIASQQYKMLAESRKRAVRDNISDLEYYAREIGIDSTQPAPGTKEIPVYANVLETSFLYALTAAKYFGGTKVMGFMLDDVLDTSLPSGRMPWVVVKE